MTRRIARTVVVAAFGFATLAGTSAHAADAEVAESTTLQQEASSDVTRTKEERVAPARTKEERIVTLRTKEE